MKFTPNENIFLFKCCDVMASSTVQLYHWIQSVLYKSDTANRPALLLADNISSQQPIVTYHDTSLIIKEGLTFKVVQEK